MRDLRAACVQFCAGPDKAGNIERMAPLVERAAALGAELVLLPEKWNAASDGAALRAVAETLDGGPTVSALRGWARRHGIVLVGGSLALAAGDRVANVSPVYDRDGELLASYQKIHLFDVDVGGFRYRESQGTEPGEGAIVVEAAGVRLGLTVCYDLRFPELYAALALAGADVLTVPANFTQATGMAHWEVLLRARAIENGAYVLAAGQHGYPDGGRRPSYGHSVIVDPWGTVLAQAPEGDGVICADLDGARLRDVRERLPSLAHRRPAAYAVGAMTGA
jgi:deaminated glutathione amidase